MRVLVLMGLALWGTTSFIVVAQERSCDSCDSDGDVWDEASGLCLPSKIKGFETASFPEEYVQELKSYRNTIISGYNVPERLAITIYIFDREESNKEADSSQFRLAVDEILGLHEGANLEGVAAGTLPISGQSTDFMMGFFNSYEGPADYGSMLFLGPWSDRYIKFRASYPRPPGQEDDTMVFAAGSVQEIAENICAVR